MALEGPQPFIPGTFSSQGSCPPSEHHGLGLGAFAYAHLVGCRSFSEPQKLVAVLDHFPAVPSPCNQGQSTEPLLWAVLSALGMRPWR